MGSESEGRHGVDSVRFRHTLLPSQRLPDADILEHFTPLHSTLPTAKRIYHSAISHPHSHPNPPYPRQSNIYATSS
jgi:hypothetical protein